MRVDLITPAAGHLLDVAEAEAFARAPGGAEAGWVGWIATAEQLAQEWTARQFLAAEFEAVLPAFPCDREVRLAPAPLLEVVSVSYRNGGVPVTLSAAEYTVIAPQGPTAGPGAIWAETWPRCDRHPEAVRIRFRAGHGEDSATVFAALPTLRTALLKGAAEAYARRETADVLRAMLPELQALQAAV